MTITALSPPGASDRPLPPVPGMRHRFVDVRGARLHVAEAGDSDGDPVVLLHGFPQHWYAWRHVVPLLAGQYRLICPDWRGFGWSEAPPRGYDTASRAADILALMDALGLPRARLVAHDWGAHPAFLAALQAPGGSAICWRSTPRTRGCSSGGCSRSYGGSGPPRSSSTRGSAGWCWAAGRG